MFPLDHLSSLSIAEVMIGFTRVLSFDERCCQLIILVDDWIHSFTHSLIPTPKISRPIRKKANVFPLPRLGCGQCSGQSTSTSKFRLLASIIQGIPIPSLTLSPLHDTTLLYNEIKCIFSFSLLSFSISLSITSLPSLCPSPSLSSLFLYCSLWKYW
jgi:hypothetical protein